MAATTYDKENYTLTIKDKDWELTDNGENGLLLTRSYRLRATELYLQAADPLTIAYFTTATEQLQMPLQSGNILTMFGKPQFLKGTSAFYWVEMRENGNILVDSNGNSVVYYAGFVLNTHNEKCLYIFASIVCNLFIYEKLPTFEAEILQVLRGIHFTPPTPTPPIFKAAATQLSNKFNNTKLHFMDSYSSGYHAGGGGYSIEETIRLYGDGTFRYDYQSVTSAPSFNGMSLGSGYSTDKGAGQWQILSEKLYLQFSDGRTKIWALQLGSGVVYLEGKKFHWSRL